MWLIGITMNGYPDPVPSFLQDARVRKSTMTL